MAKLKNSVDKVFGESNHSINESFEPFKGKHHKKEE
jgi:hypothetical protein